MSVLRIVVPCVVIIYLGVSILRGWPAKIMVVTGLALFALATIIYAATKSDRSEDVAIFAFYFLAAGTILFLIEHLRKRWPKSADEGEKDRD